MHTPERIDGEQRTERGDRENASRPRGTSPPSSTERIINEAFDRFDADIKRLFDEHEARMAPILAELREAFNGVA